MLIVKYTRCSVTNELYFISYVNFCLSMSTEHDFTARSFGSFLKKNLGLESKSLYENSIVIRGIGIPFKETLDKLRIYLNNEHFNIELDAI